MLSKIKKGVKEMGDRLKGRVAVVTGSGQGVGKGIAIGLAKEGAKVVTNNRRPGSSLSDYGDEFAEKLTPEEKEHARQLMGDAETVAKQIREMGGEAVPFFGDVGDFKTAGRLIQTAVDKFGKIDILVNNAGTFRMGSIWELSEEDWDHVTLSKLKGTFNCIRHAAPLMKEQRWGRILNCSSGAWLGGGGAAYSSANAGVAGLTRAVARELYPYGVTCNAFYPWAFGRQSVSVSAQARMMGTTRPEPPPPEPLAPFIAYLATDEAAYISGSEFRVVGNLIALYAGPEGYSEEKKVIEKEAGLWTDRGLAKVLP